MAQYKQKKPNAGDSTDGPRRVKLYFQGAAETPAERMAAIRQLRKGQILNFLLQEGPASRVDISRALGFNLRTVSLLVASLIKDNVVAEKPVLASTAMGRRPVPLELNFSAACILAIDVGRTETIMVLMDLKGKVLVRDEKPSDFEDTPAKQGAWLVKTVRTFLQESHGNLPPLTGAGLSCEGFIFRQHATFHHSTDTEDIRKQLEDALHIPVSSDTDSRLVAVAEQRFGTAQGARNAVIFNVRDGLGLGAIVDGKILGGEHGFAGEIGHIPLGDPGIPCYCGSSGCLENVVSGSGLARLAVKAGLYPDEQSVDLDKLVKSAASNKAAADVIDTFTCRLATAIVMAANLFNPDIIVIGGPLAHHIAGLKEKLQDAIKGAGVPFIMDRTRIAFSTLGDNAVLLGAAGQILNHIYSAAHVPAESLL
jgi:predicted NBD/HSP70 family sugar kinase